MEKNNQWKPRNLPWKERGWNWERGDWIPTSIKRQIQDQGVWVVRNLREYHFTRYYGCWCMATNKEGCVIVSRAVYNHAGKKKILVLAKLAYRDFGILWHVDKDELVKICERRQFQVGIHSGGYESWTSRRRRKQGSGSGRGKRRYKAKR